jgi:glutamine synthetase
MLEWLATQGENCALRAVVCDLNGIFRGKRVPLESARRALEGALKMPLSTLFVDVWGGDALASGMVLETGDRDGHMRPTERGFLPVDWLGTPGVLLPCSMVDEAGKAYPIDARNLLASITERWHARGLKPVCALELEFYLHEASASTVQPPLRPDGARLSAGDVYSLQDLEGFDAFLGDVYAACRTFGIAAGEATSETGCGQFEINFNHVDDPLRAADDAQLFKYLVKGVAAKHDLGATFMAKPYGDDAGSGMHVHFSVVDDAGRNVFADDTGRGSPLLHAAIGGLIEDLPDAMLVFAPHFNSFRRFQDSSHAPTRATWGYENRTAALRVPSGPNESRRIEHRVAGADANPYLVLATILGSALRGIEEEATPPPPLEGSAYDSDAVRLPLSWADAIHRFGESDTMVDVLGAPLMRVFAAAKQQESDTFAAQLSTFEVETYLDLI